MDPRGAVTLNRIVPALGPEAYKSYSWRQPLRTHFRRVTCADAQCADYLHGWTAVIDTATELGQRQYDYLTRDRTRQFHMERSGTSLVSFTYPPGQEAFDGPLHDHYQPIGYDPVMLVCEGDWRGNPRGTPPRIMRPEDWVDDFATHQDMIATAVRKG